MDRLADGRIYYVVSIDGTSAFYELRAGAIPGYTIRAGDPIVMLTCPR